MKKLLTLGTALAGLLAASSATAADAPAAPIPASGSSVDWNGCYVGLHAAYGWGTNKNSFNTAIKSDPTESGEPPSAEFNSFNHSTSGPGFGGQLGCNFQNLPSQWVWGLEGELMWSGMKGHQQNAEDAADPGDFSRFESANRWDADIALRLGYAWDDDLLYGKVGVAFGGFRYNEFHDDFPTTHACGGSGVCERSFTNTRAGLLLGIGWEDMISSHWSIKAEYNYDRFGTAHIPYPDAAIVPPVTVSVRDSKNIVKIGVNYHF